MFMVVDLDFYKSMLTQHLLIKMKKRRLLKF